MGFHNMPDLGPMLMPGAQEYGNEMIERAKAAAVTHSHEMDIAYGADQFQQLDVWRAQRPLAGGVPVVIFFHGGAFRNGHKEWIGAMAPALTALPAVLVSPNYRLVPRVKIPDAVEDCLDALGWVYGNISRYGGDPNRLYVGGHSAGAYLATMLTLRKDCTERRNVPHESIRGCLAISGVFDMRRGQLDSASPVARFWDEMLGDDRVADSYSADNYIAGKEVPIYVSLGDREPSYISRECEKIIGRASKVGCLFASETFSNSDHFDAHRHALEVDGRWVKTVGNMLKSAT